MRSPARSKARCCSAHTCATATLNPSTRPSIASSSCRSHFCRASRCRPSLERTHQPRFLVQGHDHEWDYPTFQSSAQALADKDASSAPRLRDRPAVLFAVCWSTSRRGTRSLPGGVRPAVCHEGRLLRTRPPRVRIDSAPAAATGLMPRREPVSSGGRPVIVKEPRDRR
jgi:hypothetical protein